MLSVNLDKARHDLGTSAAGRTDYRVFTCLTEYMNIEGAVTIAQTVIAEETGYRRRTVSTSIHRLQDKSLLTIEKTIKNNTGIAGNIYHINPKYLTKPAQHTSKPHCAACYGYKQHSQCGHKPEITIDDVLAYSGANSQRIEGLWKRVTKLEDHQRDVDDHLAQIGEVAADVIKNIFALYEEKSNK